ncbi:uncharacterized protein LOC103574874 isoform X1 [Microplitis demolitor]|uniref:uncharacterized protein LOC103574874 isoform X1 n=1 Tax=Microplitis demolitor TaxID=69319 RepID=UPI00043FFF45|nr:uncharacterized protein LOC103574874 isoform X1 [Microplitis demolitor]
MPLNFSLRHAYLESETDSVLPMAPNIYIITPIQHEQECAGRSLATLLISWVAVAMLGAILLRWEHMWIALTVLTLLFLMMCAYAIKLKRQTPGEIVGEDRCYVHSNNSNNDISNSRNIQTVSGSVDNFTEIIQPPAYQQYWINDLPPSYSAAIGTELPIEITRTSLPILDDNYATITSNPPAYCTVIQLDSIGTHTIDGNEQQLVDSVLPPLARNLNSDSKF